ncbi:helicase with zinc finger domain 2-like [Pontoporia blainvillei]|uniref:Helicase with zinc finger domain 2-like n=1 Tax=Pontoporia blainvillei TaxID=48723 RepID=A0ABX0SAF3_PONBL|nr:helicase with zinc finger domain 2-like [Pontoporia blainvillei]
MEPLLSPGAPALEFFTDVHMLNSVMTHAQSQAVAVGDAVSLCSLGACSQLWTSFLAVYEPATGHDAEPTRQASHAVQQETFGRGTTVPPGDEHHGPIRLQGRLYHGMAFAGDEVRVKVLIEGFTGPLGHACFYYPLGGVLKALPEATTWEQSLRIPELERGLRWGASSDPALVSEALQNHHTELSRVPSCWEECRSFPTLTVDAQGTCNLDDAPSASGAWALRQLPLQAADEDSAIGFRVAHVMGEEYRV